MNQKKNAPLSFVNNGESWNDHAGKLVRLHQLLNPKKKLLPTDLILLISNHDVDKLVNAPFSLNDLKKESLPVVILLILNDQVGRLVNAQF